MCDRARAKARRRRQTVRERAAPAEPLVRRAAHAALEGLVEHLAERGVRVDGHRELAQVDAVLDGVGHLLDEVGGVQTHDVARDDLGRVCAEDDLTMGGEESVTPGGERRFEGRGEWGGGGAGGARVGGVVLCVGPGGGEARVGG